MKLATTTADFSKYGLNPKESIKEILKAGFKNIDYNFGYDHKNRCGLYSDNWQKYADELLEMAANGEPYNKKQLSMTYILMVIGGALLIPFIIAKMMTNSKLAKMKTAVENDYAANYVKPGSKQLTMSRDIFLYSHITKTEKPKNNSESHKSSSGRTHGGGGGSF